MNKFEFCNDQPGRFLAVFVFSPLIILRGYKYGDTFLIIFGLVLFVWDLYHIIFTKPNEYIYKNIFEDKDLELNGEEINDDNKNESNNEETVLQD